jgi:hypothetical protein
VLSGIPASGTGSITANISVDDDAWQGVSDGKPTYFCAWDGYIYPWPIASSTYNGITITIDHWEDDSETLTKTDSMDVISELCSLWLQWRIERVKKEADWKDTRTEFYAMRNEYFALNQPNLDTSFDVDIDDEQSYTA